MAGIAGIAGQSASQERLRKMLNKLRHRGPDDQWMETNGTLALGVCMSNLGQEKGPGHARANDVEILFDGEIYNDRPAGASDAQVALELYREHGRTFAAHLQGAFACAVCDGEDVILARDAVSIRPLYWGRDGAGAFLFASEMKALVGIVDDINEMQPATVLGSTTGLQPYLPLYPRVHVPDTVEEAQQALRDLLFRATERRLADGRVGAVLLSGGLDSSIIAAIAHTLDPGLPALTVGVEGAPDIENAVQMAEHIGVEHRLKLFDEAEIKALVPKAVYALESFDEDCVSGTIANLVASKWAFEHTNCILSGEGGDELNGGYLMLKELDDEESRRRCMEELIAVAYNTALQRLDRAMMQNYINYRTPFLDSEVIAFCLQLPIDWKVHDNGGGQLVEKWLLREAFKDMLPEEIYRREKSRFSIGTGTDVAIEGLAEQMGSAEEFAANGGRTQTGYQLQSAKEHYYYKLFKSYFPDPAFEALVGRWDPAKGPATLPSAAGT